MIQYSLPWSVPVACKMTELWILLHYSYHCLIKLETLHVAALLSLKVTIFARGLVSLGSKGQLLRDVK